VEISEFLIHLIPGSGTKRRTEPDLKQLTQELSSVLHAVRRYKRVISHKVSVMNYLHCQCYAYQVHVIKSMLECQD